MIPFVYAAYLFFAIVFSILAYPALKLIVYWAAHTNHYRGECPCGFKTTTYRIRRVAFLRFFAHCAFKHPTKSFIGNIETIRPGSPIVVPNISDASLSVPLEFSVPGLKDGDMVERDGVKYRVRKNNLGTLYLSSVGQLGRTIATQISPSDFARDTAERAREQIDVRTSANVQAVLRPK